jgi:hypothetical protein
MAAISQSHLLVGTNSYNSLNFTLMIVAKGTGIKVFNAIYEIINITFTLDRGSSSASGLQTCRPWCYNTSVYITQSLTYGAHTLNITMLTYTLNDSIYHSSFWFDYAFISSPMSSGIPLAPQSQYVLLLRCSSRILTLHRKRLPAAIGGAIGGTAIIALALLYY